MRLSKTRKEVIREHQGMAPSKTELIALRKLRKKQNKVTYDVLVDNTVRQNPKHDRSARRKRPKGSDRLPGNYVPVISNNKYDKYQYNFGTGKYERKTEEAQK